jgi:hypothetical protein
VREDAVRVSKGGRELSRKEARVPIRWKAPRPFRGRYSSRGGVQRRSQAGCRSDGSLQPRRRGPVGNAGAREERRGGASANADPLLGPLGPRGVTLRKQPVRLAPEQHITWLAAGCLGNLTTRQREAAQSRITRARTSRTHGVSVRRYVIAEVSGRRFGPEKRWRFTLLTRKSDASVAGGLGRRGQLVMGKPVEERSASEETSTVGPRRQSRGIDERWRRT